MSMSNKITVLAELEEYDDASAVIVWLIEQKYNDLSSATLQLSELPQQAYGRGYFETLQSQDATLKGYTKEHGKAELFFNAEVIEIPAPEDGENAYSSGYKVTVEKRRDTYDWRKVKVAEYTIKGDCREEFEIVKEEEKEEHGKTVQSLAQH